MAVDVSRGDAAYALSGRAPEITYAPRTIEELAADLRACDERGAAVVFFGGNTLQALGNVPARYDAAIDMRALDAIVEFEPRDLTISVEAGMTVATLERTLAEHGQFVPLDVPRASNGTVGGALATGWLGPRRETYGRARDYVIGTTVVLADGTIAKSGGMVVKNVTGYALSKLYIGSLGTLGAIARANFKTRPLPESRRIAIASLPERTRVRAVANLAALDDEPAAAVVVRGFPNEIDGRDGFEGRLLILFEGSARAVDRATRDVRSALGSAGVPETRLVDREVSATFAHVIDAYVASLGARSATYCSYGFPDDVDARRDAFARAALAHDLALETIEDVRSGDVVARVSAQLTGEFLDRCAAFDADRRAALSRTRVYAAPGAARAHLEGWSDEPSALAKMRDVKARFDPRATLAPGRFVGGI